MVHQNSAARPVQIARKRQARPVYAGGLARKLDLEVFERAERRRRVFAYETREETTAVRRIAARIAIARVEAEIAVCHGIVCQCRHDPRRLRTVDCERLSGLRVELRRRDVGDDAGGERHRVVVIDTREHGQLVGVHYDTVRLAGITSLCRSPVRGIGKRSVVVAVHSLPCVCRV